MLAAVMGERQSEHGNQLLTYACSSSYVPRFLNDWMPVSVIALGVYWTLDGNSRIYRFLGKSLTGARVLET